MKTGTNAIQVYQILGCRCFQISYTRY